jgi:hypothetical protein
LSCRTLEGSLENKGQLRSNPAPRQIACETLSQTTLHKKRAGRVTQEVEALSSNPVLKKKRGPLRGTVCKVSVMSIMFDVH